MAKVKFRQFTPLYGTKTVYAQFDVTWNDGTCNLAEKKYGAYPDLLDALRDIQLWADDQEKLRAARPDDAPRIAALAESVSHLHFDMLGPTGKAITGSVLVKDVETGQIITRIVDEELAEL